VGMSELASENSNNSRGGREAAVLSTTGFPLTGLRRAPDVGPPDPRSEARAALNTSARANLVQIRRPRTTSKQVNVDEVGPPGREIRPVSTSSPSVPRSRTNRSFEQRPSDARLGFLQLSDKSQRDIDDKSRAESSTPDRRLRSAGSTRVGRAALLRLTTPP